jgi:hypothetical protein
LFDPPIENVAVDTENSKSKTYNTDVGNDAAHAGVVILLEAKLIQIA